jgi:hypothetical protein
MNTKQKVLVLAIATALSLGTSNTLFADSKGNKPDDKDKGKPVAVETTTSSDSTSSNTTDEGDDNI